MADENTPPDEGESTETPAEPTTEVQASESPRAEVPPEVKRALQKANKEAEGLRLRLKEIEDRDLSELEKAKRDAQEASTRLAEYERTTLRQRVALEKGLPASLVARLQGATEEEVSADADSLMALIKAPITPRPDTSQGARPASAQETIDAEYERFYPSNPR